MPERQVKSIKCQQSANDMIGNNAELEKKSDEISAQDVDIISAPKIVTVESILLLPTNFAAGFVEMTITSIEENEILIVNDFVYEKFSLILF